MILFVRISQDVTPAPDRLDVMPSTGCRLQFLAQLADKHVDDFQFGLVHAAVEMIEEHLFGERRPLPQGKQLEHLIFLARQMDPLAVDIHRFGVEVDPQFTSFDDRLRMALRAAYDGVDASDELVLVERLRHIIIGAEAEPSDLVVDLSEARKN